MADKSNNGSISGDIVVEKSNDDDINRAIVDIVEDFVKDKDVIDSFLKSGLLTETIQGRNFCG
jgi:hypothetical protein